MRIGRTLPPAATPIGFREIISGIWGIFLGQKELDRFQSELKEHFGVKHCFLVSSGKAALTLILLAVIPAHLFGFPSDVPRLRKLMRDPRITIVEDAAQAMGETWEGRKLGTLGDVSFFSLGRGKAFSSVEGGVIITDRDDIAEVLN